MFFKNPAMLWGLFALAIPVLIHLFYFRRVQRVLFTNVAFLKSATQQERSVRNLREWLVLAARLLFVAFAVLAFARPALLPEGGRPVSGTIDLISVFVDNSYSMSAEGENGNRLSDALQNARSIAGSVGAQARLRLFTCDFEGRHQRFYTPTEFERLLDEVELSPVSRSLDEIIARNTEAMQNENQNADVHKLFIISDFQSNIAPSAPLSDSAGKFWIVRVGNKPFENISIDSLSVASPYIKSGETIELSLRLSNHSPRRLDGVPVRIMQGNGQKAIATVPLEREEQKSIILSLPANDTGWQALYAEVDDPELPFDNKLFFSLRPETNAEILFIGEGLMERHFASVFKADSFFQPKYLKPGSIVFSELPLYRLIIIQADFLPASGLVSELKQAAKNGQSVLLFPPADKEVSKFSEWVSALGLGYCNARPEERREVVSLPGADNPHFLNVFTKIKGQVLKPELNKFYNLTLSPGQIKLLATEGGFPLFTRQNEGQGYLYLLSASPDDSWGTFGSHFLFYPLVANMVFGGLATADLYYTFGDSRAPALGINLAESGTLTMQGSGTEWIPSITRSAGKAVIDIGSGNSSAGNFSLVQGGKNFIRFVSLNYSRSESLPKFLKDDEIRSFLPGARLFFTSGSGEEFNQQISGAGERELWKYFIWAAIAMLAVEIFLLRSLLSNAPSPAKPNAV